MDIIKVVIRKDTGAIEITPELIEQALNYYFGMDASVTVFHAAGVATCSACGRELLPDGSCPNDDPSTRSSG